MASVPVVQQGGWRDSMSRFGYQLRKSPLTMLGPGIIVVVIVAVACANFLAPYAPNMISLAQRLAPPSARHRFGQDAVGRDIFSRVLDGGRQSVARKSVA